MIRFLERNGYDVSYLTGVDSDRRGNLLKNHKVFLSVGHDEYWCGPQRANVEAARDAGVNLRSSAATRSTGRPAASRPSTASSTPYRTLVCYKETWANAKIDPSARVDRHLARPAVRRARQRRRQPENALTGTAYMANFTTTCAITVHAGRGQAAAVAQHRRCADLAAGQTATLAPHTVGYESDEDLDNGFRPAGLIQLSTTTGATPEYLQDFGNTVAPGHDHAPPDPVQGAQRRAGLQRRHHPVGLGPGRRATTGVRARPADTRMQQARSTCWPTWARSRRR